MSILVRISSLRGYESLMHQLGSNPGEILSRYRIDPSLLADEDALLPFRTVIQLLEASSRETGCQDFGLRLADRQDISVLGPLAIVMRNALTVGHALEDVSRYLFVQSPGLAVSTQPNSPFSPHCTEVRVEIRVDQQLARRQALDLCLGDLHRMLKLLAGNSYRLKAVSLPHSMLAPARSYRQFFGAPVLGEETHAGLHVSKETIQAKLKQENSVIHQIATEYLSMSFETPEQAMSARVRQALRRTLGTSLANKTEIAALFTMHPRTLQRCLAAEGTSFDRIRDEFRKETAARYLGETQIALGQLAGILGLSEHSALSRCSQRWFGMSPTQFRNLNHRR